MVCCDDMDVFILPVAKVDEGMHFWSCCIAMRIRARLQSKLERYLVVISFMYLVLLLLDASSIKHAPEY
jgi:hypothetical protein